MAFKSQAYPQSSYRESLGELITVADVGIPMNSLDLRFLLHSHVWINTDIDTASQTTSLRGIIFAFSVTKQAKAQ